MLDGLAALVPWTAPLSIVPVSLKRHFWCSGAAGLLASGVLRCINTIKLSLSSGEIREGFLHCGWWSGKGMLWYGLRRWLLRLIVSISASLFQRSVSWLWVKVGVHLKNNKTKILYNLLYEIDVIFFFSKAKGKPKKPMHPIAQPPIMILVQTTIKCQVKTS